MDTKISYGELLAIEWALDELVFSLESLDDCPSRSAAEKRALLDRVRSMIEGYPHEED